MIKLKNILEIDDIVYSDSIKPKHRKKIDMQTELIGEVLVPVQPCPDNSSKKTRGELQWLLNYNNGVIDRDVSKEGDDVIKVFEKYCKENNLDFDKKYYEKILKESAKTILILKYHYNRPRPYQLGEFYGIEDFKIHNLDSAKTPSYPSGHTTQGYLIAHLLGKKHTGHYDNFKQLANFISNSRLMARAHYPSDCEFGKKVAEYIVGSVK